MPHRRILVAVPRSSCEGGAPLLQIGLVRWRTPPVRLGSRGAAAGARPALTLIAKATYSFEPASPPPDPDIHVDPSGAQHAHSGAQHWSRARQQADPSRARQQADPSRTPLHMPAPEGLALDLPCDWPGADPAVDIAYPSDFVPRKSACDLLLHGHAYATHPSTRFLCGVEIAGVARDFVVKAPSPAHRAPLLAGSILDTAGSAAAERVGPAPAHRLLDEHPEGFDFSLYNAAPPSLRVPVAPLGEALLLRGLSARAEELSIPLPAVSPVAFIDRGGSRPVPVPMACDTVWIDTDGERLVLVFRGHLHVPSLDFPGVHRVTVALGPLAAPPAWEEVARDLDPRDPQGGYLGPAAEPGDFTDGAPAALAAEEAALERHAAWATPREPALSLEEYALISAALAERPERRAATLRDNGLDEGSFLAEERGWLEGMARAAGAGDTGPILRYSDLLMAAQDGLAGPAEGRETMDDYVAHKVAIEGARDVPAALAARGLTFAVWMRMDRRWRRRALAERPLAAEIERRAQLRRKDRGAG